MRAGFDDLAMITPTLFPQAGRKLETGATIGAEELGAAVPSGSPAGSSGQATYWNKARGSTSLSSRIAGLNPGAWFDRPAMQSKAAYPFPARVEGSPAASMDSKDFVGNAYKLGSDGERQLLTESPKYPINQSLINLASELA